MSTSVGKLSYADVIERDGFTVVKDALDETLISELTSAIESVKRGEGVYDRGGVYAMRNLFHLVPDVKKALTAPKVQDVVESVLGPDAFCVRGLFLNKTPKANWSVSWHQDATVTVQQRGDATGFSAWSTKAGVQHVMAPPGLLSYMLTLRLHLDDCGENQGALKAIMASHQYGRLPEDSLEQFTRGEVTSCNAAQGDILAFRPLLIHGSEAAREPGARRVVQLDFCARALPLPLKWHETHSISAA